MYLPNWEYLYRGPSLPRVSQRWAQRRNPRNVSGLRSPRLKTTSRCLGRAPCGPSTPSERGRWMCSCGRRIKIYRYRREGKRVGYLVRKQRDKERREIFSKSVFSGVAMQMQPVRSQTIFHFEPFFEDAQLLSCVYWWLANTWRSSPPSQVAIP